MFVYGVSDYQYPGDRVLNNAITAAMFGVVVEIKQTETWRHQLTVSWVERGAQRDYQSWSPYYIFPSRIGLSIVEISLMEKRLFGSAPLRPFIGFGPSLGFLQSATAQSHGSVSDGDTVLSITHDFRHNLWSMNMAGGIEYQLNNRTSLTASMTLVMGLLGAWDPDAGHVYADNSQFTQDIGFTFGILVGL